MGTRAMNSRSGVLGGIFAFVVAVGLSLLWTLPGAGQGMPTHWLARV